MRSPSQPKGRLGRLSGWANRKNNGKSSVKLPIKFCCPWPHIIIHCSNLISPTNKNRSAGQRRPGYFWVRGPIPSCWTAGTLSKLRSSLTSPCFGPRRRSKSGIVALPTANPTVFYLLFVLTARTKSPAGGCICPDWFPDEPIRNHPWCGTLPYFSGRWGRGNVLVGGALGGLGGSGRAGGSTDGWLGCAFSFVGSICPCAFNSATART